jgi:uncharacterized protein DUF4238
LEISSKRIQKRHTGRVCCITNFYDIDNTATLKRFGIDNPRIIETSFKYENSLGKILSKIKNRNPFLFKKDFQTIIETYVSLKHRTPYFRKQIENNKLASEALDNTIREFSEEYRALFNLINYDFNTLAAKFRKDSLADPNRGKNFHLSGLLDYSRTQNEPVKDAINKIIGMNISIIEAPSACYFFTSDNPGYSLDGNKIFNTNFGQFNMIHFPINSKQMILFSGFNPLNHLNPIIRLNYFKANTAFVKEVNRMALLVTDQKV